MLSKKPTNFTFPQNVKFVKGSTPDFRLLGSERKSGVNSFSTPARGMDASGEVGGSSCSSLGQAPGAGGETLAYLRGWAEVWAQPGFQLRPASRSPKTSSSPPAQVSSFPLGKSGISKKPSGKEEK